jgi:hypothetical protein
VKEKGRDLEHHWNSKHNNQGAKNENTVSLPTNQRYKSLQFNKKDDRNGAANYVHSSPKLGRIEAPHEKLKVSNSICSNRAFIEWVDKGVAQLISTESGIRIFKQRILILFKFNNYPPLPWVGLSDEVPEKPH